MNCEGVSLQTLPYHYTSIWNLLGCHSTYHAYHTHYASYTTEKTVTQAHVHVHIHYIQPEYKVCPTVTFSIRGSPNLFSKTLCYMYCVSTDCTQYSWHLIWHWSLLFMQKKNTLMTINLECLHCHNINNTVCIWDNNCRFFKKTTISTDVYMHPLSLASMVGLMCHSFVFFFHLGICGC